MTVIKCDRCGEEIQNPDEVYIVESGFRMDQRICRPDRFELCEDCKETLLAWLHPERESQT